MLDKLLESGVSKLCELKFANDDYGYINVGYDRGVKKCKCKVCKETIYKGELRIWNYSYGRGIYCYFHPNCFFAVFIENMMKLEDELGRVG